MWGPKMKRHSREFRVGALVLATAGLFCVFVVFLLGSSFDSERARYHILFEENVKGMVIGSSVNFQGVPVGKVTDMAFEGGKTHVQVDVDPRKCEIQDVTQARLDRLLVTGQVTVELEGWAPGRPKIAVGTFIEPKDDPIETLKLSMPELIAQVQTTLERTDATLASVQTLLGPETQQRVHAILAQVEDLTTRLPDRIDGTLAEVQGAAQGFTRVADATHDILTGEPVRALLDNANRAASGLIAMEATVEGLAREATAVVQGARHPLLGALLSARESLREIQGLARRLQLAPTSLIFGAEQGEIAVQPAAAPGGGR